MWWKKYTKKQLNAQRRKHYAMLKEAGFCYNIRYRVRTWRTNYVRLFIKIHKVN